MSKPRGSEFKEVRHRAWRDFDEVRRAATNAIAGLGFGLDLARLDAQTREEAGDDRRFSEVFRSITAATDFDFRPEPAKQELSTAEASLAQMTVPFSVSIYNEYLIDVVCLFERWHPSGFTQEPRTMSLGDLSSRLADSYGVSLTGYQGELLALLAYLRNRIVHYGGRASAQLAGRRRALSPEAERAWERVAGRPMPVPVVGQAFVLGRRDAAAALATVDHAASQLNSVMRNQFSASFWADVAVEDYVQQFPRPWHFGDTARREKAIRGYVSRDYAGLGITADEVADAVARAS